MNPAKLLRGSLYLLCFTSFCLSGFSNNALLAQESEDQLWCTYLPGEIDGAAADNGKHIVLIAGDDEYRSEEAMPMLGKLLSQRIGFKCTVLFPIDEATGEIKPDHQTNIPGMQHLQDCDLVILGLRFRGLPDEQMKYLDDYLMAGKPVIAVRTSTHAFRFTKEMESAYQHYDFRSKEKWPLGFGKQVLGETWFNHHGRHGKQSTRGVTNEEHADDVLMTGVSDVWGPTDVYGVRKLPEGSKVLLYGQVIDGMEPDDEPLAGAKNDPMMPLAWTRTWTASTGNECSVFCTTMGSSTDFENAGLRRLLVNASLAMTGLGDQIEDVAGVDPVGEFNPTNFGFKSYKKGTKPADYNLK